MLFGEVIKIRCRRCVARTGIARVSPGGAWELGPLQAELLSLLHKARPRDLGGKTACDEFGRLVAEAVAAS